MFPCKKKSGSEAEGASKLKGALKMGLRPKRKGVAKSQLGPIVLKSPRKSPREAAQRVEHDSTKDLLRASD